MSDLTPQLSDLLPLLPGAGAGVALVAIATWVRHETTRCALSSFAVVTCVFVTWLQIHDGLPWEPRQSTERVLWGTVAWGLAAAALGASKRPQWLSPTVAAATAGAVILWILWPLVDRDPGDDARIGTWLCASLACGIAVIATTVRRPANYAPAFTVPATIGMATGATAHVLFLFGSASLAQLLGSVGMICGASTIFALTGRLAAGAAPAVTGVVALVAIDGWGFMDSTPPTAALLALAAVPLAPWTSSLAFVRNATPSRRAMWVLAVAAVLVGTAITIAVVEMPPTDDYGDLYK